MSFVRREIRCPECQSVVAFDKALWHGNSRCPQCGTSLLISVAYARMLMVVSEVLGFGLPWVAHLPKLLILALGPLMGVTAVIALSLLLSLAIFVLLVRTVPRLISPPLVIQNHGPITVLNLTVDPREQSSNNNSEE